MKTRLKQQTHVASSQTDVKPHAPLRSLTLASLLVLIALAFGTSSASAATAWWHLDASAAPANLPPGGTGMIFVSATNLGDANVDGSNAPVKLIDKLPKGIEAKEPVVGTAGLFEAEHLLDGSMECKVPSPHVVECTFLFNYVGGEYRPSLRPYERLEAEIEVNVASDANLHETNEVAVTGGETAVCEKTALGAGRYVNGLCVTEGPENGHEEIEGDFEEEPSGKPVPEAAATGQLTVSSAPVEFGVEKYELTAASDDGSPARQAGSHPFGLTTTLDLNRTSTEPYQPAPPKDLQFKLPPGLIGNPTPFPQCTSAQFITTHGGEANECPADTAVGVAVVAIRFPESPENVVLTVPVPVFNLKPAVGEPARFGWLVGKRVPGDPRHLRAHRRGLRRDGQRGQHHADDLILQLAGHLLGRPRSRQPR